VCAVRQGDRCQFIRDLQDHFVVLRQTDEVAGHGQKEKNSIEKEDDCEEKEIEVPL